MAFPKSRFQDIFSSVYLDVNHGLLHNNHTTTINVYKLNYAAIIFTLGSFVIAIAITFFILRGKSTKNLKPPVSTVFFLTKTALKPEHAELCMRLIERESFDVNYIPSDGQLSLFLCACLSGNAKLASFMLHKGANIHSFSNFGDSAFYLAVSGLGPKDEYHILDLLLNAGSEINCQNKSGFTAFHLACSRGNFALVKYLLNNGANPSISTFESVLPHELALNKGYSDIVEYILNFMRTTKRSQETY